MLGLTLAPPGAVVLLQRGVEVVGAFFFFLYEWRAAATAAAGSAARAVPPPSLREEVKATFTPLRAWAGTVSVAGGRGDTAASGSWAESWVGEDTPRSRDFYPPQAVGRAGEREDPC